MQELLEELHHIPRVIEITHQNRKAYRRVYVNLPKSTGRLPIGIQERSPVGSGAGRQEPCPGTSNPAPRNLGTAALHQGNSSTNSPLYSLERYSSGTHVGNIISVVSRPSQVTSQKKQFFEVCINTGNHAVRLKEIDLALVASDRDLFNQIWDRYRHTRGYGIRKIFLKPRDVHFVMVSPRG